MDASVVICSYNRCSSLKKALMSLDKLSIPQELTWETVVVDNKSTDQTKEVVEGFAAQSRWAVRYVFEPKPGLSQARNRGVQEARGEIIAFIDDDVKVTPAWLAEVKNAFEEYDASCVGGKILLGNTLQLPPWWDERYSAVLTKFDLGDSVILGDRNYEGEIGWGANISFRRCVFEKYGLFRTDLGRTPNGLAIGEETELVRRLQRNGELSVYYPASVVYHFPDTERLSKQYLRRWYYRAGESYRLQDSIFRKRTPRIFGVPRWRYRSALESIGKGIFSWLTGRRGEAFYQQLQFIVFLGYLGAAPKNTPLS